MASAPAGRPPELSSEIVAVLVKEKFPFSEVDERSVKQLPSYDDRNFYFRGRLEDDETRTGAGPVQEYVIKVNNSLMSCELIDGLNAIMCHLNSKGFRCPSPLVSRKGTSVEVVSENLLVGEEQDGKQEQRKFCIRILTYIPGEMMDKIDKVHLTPTLCFNIGKYIGHMDVALQDFSHPTIEARVFLDWDLQHFLHIRNYFPSIDDPKKRQMAEAVLKGFEEHIFPKISSMKRGVIHGDPNGLNIVLESKNGTFELSALIDFGECVNTCCMFECAMMLAYAMLEKDNPLHFVCPMLSGYHQAFPLNEEELNCLYFAVLGRLCQSAVIGEYQFKQEPWNMYLLTTPVHAWRVIEEILSTPKDQVDRLWTDATKKTAADFKN